MFAKIDSTQAKCVCLKTWEAGSATIVLCCGHIYWPEPHSIANLCQFSSIYRAVDFACLNIVSLSHHHLPLLNAVVILFVIVRIINKPIYALFLLFTWWFVTASFSNRYCVLCIDLFERTKQETTTNVNAWSEQKKKNWEECVALSTCENAIWKRLSEPHTHTCRQTHARAMSIHTRNIYIYFCLIVFIETDVAVSVLIATHLLWSSHQNTIWWWCANVHKQKTIALELHDANWINHH